MKDRLDCNTPDQQCQRCMRMVAQYHIWDPGMAMKRLCGECLTPVERKKIEAMKRNCKGGME